MPWSPVPDKSSGDVFTEAMWDVYIKGNLNAIGDAWTTFTPTWTNLTVGTGGSALNQGAYMNAGKLYVVRTRTVLGTSGASVGTNPQMTLPNSSSFVAAVTNAGGTISLGTAGLLDAGTATYWAFVAPQDSTKIQLRLLRSEFVWLQTSTPTAIQPMTWVAGDEIVTQFMYEAA